MCQMLVEEKRRTLVGEHHGHTGQLGAIFSDNILGYIFQE